MTTPTGGTDPVLEITDLTAGYDGVSVIRDINLTVSPGEVVALLGPNGAGKTTTLMAVSGLVKIHRGTVLAIGEPAPKLRRAHEVAQRGVAHVPEGRGILYQLTVEENLVLAKTKGKVELDVATEYFEALAPLMKRRAGLLSGGEQQMVALARAILAEPRLLMIDEMSLGLAPIIYESLMPIVRRVADEMGAGVLLVEQYPELALVQADRGVVLNHGDIAMQGTSAELLADADALDAAYLGTKG